MVSRWVRLLLHRLGTLDIPYSPLASVPGKIVNLNVTSAAAKDRLGHRRPAWLAPEALNEDSDLLVRPHPEPGSY